MSLFSRILGAKKAADSQRKASVTSSDSAQKPESPPYRHIPVHALSDSLTLGATLPSADLHKRIKEESRRHSQRPQSLRRAGSDTFLEYRGELARQRSARNLAKTAATERMYQSSGESAGKGKAKMNMHLPFPPPPTSNPYAMPPALQSSKRGLKSPLGSSQGSPVPSTRSARSPLAGSIMEEPEDALPTPPPHALDLKKGTLTDNADGYFPLQK